MLHFVEENNHADGEIFIGSRYSNDKNHVVYPLITFIIRNWNYEKFVGTAIESVKAQDYPRFEVIIVDNNSTDGSREVIEKYVEHDPRFACVYNQENLGPLGGVLVGLDYAKGDFVCFVDSDDFLLPNFASMHIQAHLAATSNVAVTSSEVLEIGENGSLLSSGRRKRWDQIYRNRIGTRMPESIARIDVISDEQFAHFQNVLVNHPHWAVGWFWSPGTANVYRRFILEAVRPEGRPPEIIKQLAADAHFLRLSHACGGSAFIGIPLSGYRIHGQNYSATGVSLDGMLLHMGDAAKFELTRRMEAVRSLLKKPKYFIWGFGSIERFWKNIDSILVQSSFGLPPLWRTPEAVSLFSEFGPSLSAECGEREFLRQLRKRFRHRDVRLILKNSGASLQLRAYAVLNRVGRKITRVLKIRRRR